MYCFIFGFQRFVWCPKWTPASSKSFNAIPLKLPPIPLPFTELEALARALLSVLLTFLDARIARQEAFLLQPGPQLQVVFDERPGDAEAQRAGLTGNTATSDGREYVELLAGLSHDQRLLDLGSVCGGGEGLLDRLAIDDQTTVARTEKNAGGGCLAASRPVVLNSSCHYATSCLVDFFSPAARGICAAC